jgi:2-amino-4-hydroxy-6-hydroxymethyldihydropteridine diphosphokinase
LVYLPTVDHIRRVVIGLGSNLGDRAATILAAVERLRTDGELHVLELSPLYETAPVGGPSQGDFLNAAVLVLTALDAKLLLERLLGVEAALGRVRGEKNGPRTIDLDILWIEGECVSDDELVVPHPRLAERAFALRPLLDLAPDASNAETGVAFAGLPAASESLRRHGEG